MEIQCLCVRTYSALWNVLCTFFDAVLWVDWQQNIPTMDNPARATSAAATTTTPTTTPAAAATTPATIAAAAAATPHQQQQQAVVT